MCLHLKADHALITIITTIIKIVIIYLTVYVLSTSHPVTHHIKQQERTCIPADNSNLS